MSEQHPPVEEKKRFSRRTLLMGAAGMTAAAFVAAHAHHSQVGLRLNKPELKTETMYDGKGFEGRQLSYGYISVGDEQVLVTKTSDSLHNKLYFEPAGEFFVPGRKIEEVHRGGNSFDETDYSFEIGGNRFDVDANDIDGEVYAEHGIIPHFKLKVGRFALNVTLPMVFDRGESELKIGLPQKYETMVEYIASLSTPDNQLSVSTELKRGEFKPATIVRMLRCHLEHNVPVVMKTADARHFDFIVNEEII